MTTRNLRLPAVDALKAISAQLIVLHHLAFYGPMSDLAYPLAPALMNWLCEHARVAVQVFLVVGGFLAARSLAPAGQLVVANPLRTLWRRYRKLVVPYAVALLFAMAGAAIARQLMTHDSIPAAPSLLQFLVHLLLLHDVLGFDALSAGVWYVAIDLQLFALLMVALWASRLMPSAMGAARGRAGMFVVVMLVAASLYWFNRQAAWDAWAIYFFGAYGMGVLAYWSSTPGRPRWPLLALALLGALALWVDFRERIAVALAVAMCLGVAQRGAWLATWPRGGAAALADYFGRISYSVFLVHFPICLVANAWIGQWGPREPAWQACGMAGAWLVSNLAGAWFHRHVESADLPARFGALAARAARMASLGAARER
jgi:peptidoglycan/LPS O-acetylase OafA/YrhL